MPKRKNAAAARRRAHALKLRFDGKTYREIGVALACSPARAAQLVARARRETEVEKRKAPKPKPAAPEVPVSPAGVAFAMHVLKALVEGIESEQRTLLHSDYMAEGLQDVSTFRESITLRWKRNR